MCSCWKATYYEESERHFFIRASEHLGMSTLTGKRVKSPKKSAVFDHILLNGHDVSHCAKSVQIRSIFWSAFSRIRTEKL